MTILQGLRRHSLLVHVFALTVLAGLVWFGFGMDRGLLLSSDFKSVRWPWAAYYRVHGMQAATLVDPVVQFVPWLQLARRELMAGRVPLWNPHQDGGVPLLGNALSALGTPLV